MLENKEPPRRGRNEALAALVAEALERRGWSFQAAEVYSGVGHMTVKRMSEGLVGTTESIIDFARASAVKGQELPTVRRFLLAAGKTSVLTLLTDAERVARGVPADAAAPLEVLAPTGHLIEVSDAAGVVQFPATPENVAVIAAVMRALAKRSEE